MGNEIKRIKLRSNLSSRGRRLAAPFPLRHASDQEHLRTF